MAFQVSPGVEVKEIDLTTVIPASASSIGGYVGAFEWGPVNQAITVSSETELAAKFGSPRSTKVDPVHFLTCSQFLAYGNNLKVIRALETEVQPAVVIKNQVVNNEVVKRIEFISRLRNLSPAGSFTYTIKFSDLVQENLLPPVGTVIQIKGFAVINADGSPAVSRGKPVPSAINSSVTVTEVDLFDKTISFVIPKGNPGILNVTDAALANISITYGGETASNAKSGKIFQLVYTGLAADEITSLGAADTINFTSRILEIRTADFNNSGFSKLKSIYLRGNILSAQTLNGNTTVNVLVNDTSNINYVSSNSKTVLFPSDTSTLVGNASDSTDLKVTIDGRNFYIRTFSNVPSVIKFSTSARPISGVNVTTTTSDFQVSIENSNAFSLGKVRGRGDLFGQFVARYLGTRGNSIKVTVADDLYYTNYILEDPLLRSVFPKKPGTRVDNITGKTFKNYHVFVQDAGSAFTGVPNALLESFSAVSNLVGATADDGSSANVVEVLNLVNDTISKGSEYVYYTGLGELEPGVYTLEGGSNGSLVGLDDYRDALEIFANEEDVDVNLLIATAGSQKEMTVQEWSTLHKEFIQIAESRKDCIAFISPPFEYIVGNSQPVTNAVIYRTSDLNVSSSYGVMDNNWKYVYNKYFDKFDWVPLCGDIAGLCARTDQDRDPWFSPAGFNRGNIKNVVKLAYNPNKTERDELYLNGINPVVTFKGSGTILFGDKTLLDKSSAFDRINVRRLFIVLEKAISTAAKFSMFEFNDQFTRAQFISLVEPFLREVQARRGIFDFRVVCDDTNNTPEVIDTNRFVGDIYIKPARSINFITLNFVAVRTGVDFAEIVGKF